MSRPTVDSDPELAALQLLAQALDDAPDEWARERIIVWAIDRFELFDLPDRRDWLLASIQAKAARKRGGQ